jgi:triacylglycerol lipase
MKLVAWMAGALARWDGVAAPVPPEAPPVIVVHGIHSSAADMARLANHLRASGRRVFTPSLTPANGRVSIESLAKQLAEFADREVPGQKFDLVGFSMGGLVSRYYVQRLGGIDRVGRFVTLATPHNGTVMARLFGGVGHEQMRPGSEFLRDLDRDAAMLETVGFTSLYTPLDAVIVPPKSSEQSAAKNIRVWGIMHPSFVLEKRCIKAVADCLP